ncbi:MAG TPA: aromatic ring-hydroxylating dioxygenase subunit alpha [Methylotenera sp.]|nr:aromatic ring-hydroxylating dioxygenase subunit alpha [Methylotenera sp.]
MALNSTLRAITQVSHTQTQLPVACYVDANLYALEQKHLFSHTPQYIGHALMVPNVGDFRVLDWANEASSLVHDHTGLHLISNVCRHRQAIMLKGHGNAKNIVCPLHRWTYNLQGELLGAPEFDKNPCLHLNRKTLQNWQGLLFDSKRNIADELNQIGCKTDFDFTGYQLHSVDIAHYNFNWKTFIEVYLEDYHVGPYHPGLNQFVNCGDLAWDFGEHYSVQTVGFRAMPHQHATPAYQRWQEAVRNYRQPATAQTPAKYGAIWMAYYPLLMVEWYPNVLVVSHIIPQGVDACMNVVEFYYPEDIALFESEYVAAQKAAYNETAIEDQDICQRMHDGRRALFAQGLDERGPYQHPMETGLAHFHQWYRAQLAPHIAL